MSKVDDLCRKGASREEIIEALEEELAAKDALLRQARNALDELNKADDDRLFMNGGEIAMVAIAIEAIDKEIGKK